MNKIYYYYYHYYIAIDFYMLTKAIFLMTKLRTLKIKINYKFEIWRLKKKKKGVYGDEIWSKTNQKKVLNKSQHLKQKYFKYK